MKRLLFFKIVNLKTSDSHKLTATCYANPDTFNATSLKIAFRDFMIAKHGLFS